MHGRFMLSLLATAGCLFSTGAQAALDTHVVTYTSSAISIPVFNTALGTLNSAKISIVGHLDYPFLDTTSTPTPGTLDYSAFYSFYYFDRFLDVGVTGSTPVTFGAASVLYAGADGAASHFITADRLAFVQGTSGTWGGSIHVDPPWRINAGGASVVPDGVPIGSQPYFVSGTLTVEYDYVAAAGAVPEPASWAMMIAGFAMLGGALRRRPARRHALA